MAPFPQFNNLHKTKAGVVYWQLYTLAKILLHKYKSYLSIINMEISMYHVSINYESEEIRVAKPVSISLLSSDISVHGNKNICKKISNLRIYRKCHDFCLCKKNPQ